MGLEVAGSAVAGTTGSGPRVAESHRGAGTVRVDLLDVQEHTPSLGRPDHGRSLMQAGWHQLARLFRQRDSTGDRQDPGVDALGAG